MPVFFNQSLLNNLISNLNLAFLIFALDNIIIFIGLKMLFSMYGIEKKKNISKILIFCIISSTIIVILRFKVSYIAYKIFLVIFIILFGKIFFKLTIFQGINFTTKLELILTSIELIFNNYLMQIYYLDNIKIIVEITSKITIIPILLVLYYYYKENEISIKYDLRTLKGNKTSIFNYISMIIVLIQTIRLTFYIDNHLNFNIFLNIIITLALYILVCNNLKHSEEINISKNNIKSLKKYNNSLIKANDDMRCFKHDFNNIMQAIGGYIKLNDYEGLKTYYNDLLLECNLLDINPTNFNFKNQTELYNIILNKSEKAREKGINLCYSILNDFNYTENTYVKIIIKKMMDNAIKYAKYSKNKEIIADFMYDKKKNTTTILIISSYSNNEQSIIEVKKSYIKTFSMFFKKLKFKKRNINKKIKKKKHSQRKLIEVLYSKKVRKILKRINDAKLYVNIDNDLLVQELKY